MARQFLHFQMDRAKQFNRNSSIRYCRIDYKSVIWLLLWSSTYDYDSIC